MLQIIINGIEADYLKDIQINFIEENPLFHTDRIPQQYSLTFEIPVTSRNLKIFGFPDRATSKSKKLKLYGEIRHSGVIFTKGEYIVLEVDQLSIKLQFKGSRIPVELRNSINQTNIGHYQYGSFPEDYSTINYSSPQLELYVSEMKNEAQYGINYCIGPVRISGIDWTGTDFQFGITNSMRQYINYWNPSLQSFQWTETPRAHTPILPYPYVHKIITNAFGNILYSNPFAQNKDLRKLLLISMNHQNYLIDNLVHWFRPGMVTLPLIDSYTPSNGNVPIEYDLMNFTQAYPVVDLLKSLLSMFSMSCFIKGNEMLIKYNNDIMKEPSSVNWNDKLAGQPIISFEEAKRYVFKYNDIPLSEENTLTSYNTLAEIAIAAALAETTDPVIYHHSETGALYRITKSLQGLDSWVQLDSEVLKSSLNSLSNNSDDKESWEVIPEVRPVDMNIEHYWVNDKDPNLDQLRKYHWWVPSIDKKSVKDPPYIMLFGGMIKPFDDDKSSYPLITNHNVDHFGNKLNIDISLLPDGPNGLIAMFHQEMKKWVEKDKTKLKGSFLLSIKDLRKLMLSQKIYLNGMLFYIEKLSYSLNSHQISLVDADLIQC